MLIPIVMGPVVVTSFVPVIAAHPPVTGARMVSRRSFLKTAGLVLGATALPVVTRAAPSQKAVLLQCAWAVKNVGDIGHTPGTLRFLEQYLPEAKVILWAQNTNPQVDAMLMKRFPKLEIVKGSLSQKDGVVQQAIKKSDFFIRGPGMGQSTDFMKYCNQIGKPWGACRVSLIFPTW